MCEDTLMAHLKITYTRVGDDFLEAQMPVNHTTVQPMKILHGGATLALCESVGSALSVINTDMNEYLVRGMQVTANHIRSVSSGFVTAHARFLHRGRNSHLVEINVKDQQDELVSVCRLTNMIIKKERQ